MAHTFSSKRTQDDARFMAWDCRLNSDFSCFEPVRAQAKAAQIGLRGYIVLPEDPAYNADRPLFNPLFDVFSSMRLYSGAKRAAAVALQLDVKGSASFTVRCSGHGTPGFLAGAGVLIDASHRTGVHVHPQMPDRAALAPNGVPVPGGQCDDACKSGSVQDAGDGCAAAMYSMNCDTAKWWCVMPRTIVS